LKYAPLAENGRFSEIFNNSEGSDHLSHKKSIPGERRSRWQWEGSPGSERYKM
jgi:hypothetical protein